MTLYFMDTEGIELLYHVAEQTKMLTAADRVFIEAYESRTAPVDMKNNTAMIPIKGMMLPERNGLLSFLGVAHTAYSDIKSQVAQAQAAGASEIVFDINSGGGTVEGMLSTMKTIKAIDVPTVSRVTGKAASAGYMVAAQTDMIAATEETDLIGSIGVATKIPISGDYKEISNTASPDKRSDVTTPEGVAAVKAQLDDTFNTVMPYVAAGRNVTVEEASEKWGKGAVMTAKTALAVGMIDVIEEENIAGNSSGATKGQKTMKREELQAKHPELHAEVYNSGMVAGKKEIQKDAKAHITLAKASGAIDRALEDISAGNPVDAVVYSFHNAEGIKKAQIEARSEETPPVVPPAAPDDDVDADDNTENFGEVGFEVYDD